jgi:cytosine/adenosine deaminase-related metal-dependent hydrolase
MPGVPFIDTGNHLLSPVDAALETGTVDEAGGGRLAVITIRTASTTLTVMLDAPTFATWLQVLTGLQDTMGGSLQVISPEAARALGLDGHHTPG